MHQYDINKTMMAMTTRGLEITQIVRAYVNAKPSREMLLRRICLIYKCIVKHQSTRLQLSLRPSIKITLLRLIN